MSKKKESASYEEMLNRVETIVTEVGGDDLPLDHVVQHVEEAYGLITKMRERLDDSKAKVEALREQFESQMTDA